MKRKLYINQSFWRLFLLEFLNVSVHWCFMIHCYNHSKGIVVPSRSEFTESGTECCDSKTGSNITYFTTCLLRGHKASSHEPLKILFCKRKGVTSGALSVCVLMVKTHSISCLKELWEARRKHISVMSVTHE